MSKIADWITVAATGKFPQGDLTTSVFDKLVKNFNPAHHEPPHTIGHINKGSGDKPAMGWVEGIKRVGDNLLVKSKQIYDKFDTMVQDGRYKKRSIGIRNRSDGEPYLHHLAWLGATPPAVKGLSNIYSSDFLYDDENEDSEKRFDYSEKKTNIPRDPEPKLKGDPTMKEYSDSDLKLRDQDVAKLAKEEAKKEYETDLGKKIEAAEKKGSDETKTKLEAEFKEKEKSLTAQSEHVGAVDEFAKKLYEERRINPAQVKLVKQLGYSLFGPGEINYSEDNKEIKTDQYAMFKQLIEAAPVVEDNYKEPLDKNKGSKTTDFSGNQDYAEEGKRISEIKEKNPKLSHGQAMKLARAEFKAKK